MHPLFLSMACGHGSLVTPTSVLMSPDPPPLLVAPRQALSAPATTRSATVDAVVTFVWYHFMRGFLPVRCGLVGERPGLPVVPSPRPDAEESARFEDEEHDDEGAVQHRLELEHVRHLGGRVADAQIRV